MHATRIIALASILSWNSGVAERADTNATTGSTSPPESATRIWISSFQPITVTTDHRQEVPRPCTPEIPKPIALQWRTNYEFFSEHLLSAAEKAQLDSESLKKILFENKIVASLPVEAISTRFKGEPVWVVEFRWEYEQAMGDGYLVHFRRLTISRKTLKLLTIDQCG